MKLIIATIVGLAISSAIAAGAPRATNASSVPETELGTDTTNDPQGQGLLCRGHVVCISHELWCEPQCPTCGNPEPTGQSC